MNTVAAGRYAGLGGFSGPMRIPLSRSTVLLFSLPGKGKTTLVQTNPDAFIFNCDQSSTVTAKPLALIWPGVSPTGQPVNDDGRPFVLTYEHVLRKKDVLIQLARDNKERPATVVIDSLTTFITLVKPYVTANAKALNIWKENNPPESFRVLYGPAAYDCVYEQVTSFVADLRNAGYGVTILAHIVKEKIPLGDNKFLPSVDFTFGDGLWKRLSAVVDYSCLIDQVVEAEETVGTREVMVGPGKTQTVKHVETKNVLCSYIDCLNPEYAGISKTRSMFPRFKLPAVDSWAALEAHHAKHSI
jgi:hypothetical protein